MSKYLSGNATDAEVQQLEDWVSSDVAHRRQFIAYRKAWVLGGMRERSAEVDVDAQWQQTAKALFPETKVVPLRSRTYRWLAIAAAITLVGAISVWAFLQWGGERELYVTTTDQVRIVDLPDGSTVTLNRFSSLRYVPVEADPGNSQSARRQLTLAGDAFFDVEREVDRPFIIRAAELEVEVLGTSFYIDAREPQPQTQVIVASGSVAVRSANADTITLAAGQQGIYEKAVDSLYLQANEDPNFQSIKTGTISFSVATIQEIAFALSRHYGIAVVYEDIGDTSNCVLNGDYPDYTLEEILAYLRTTWGIEATRDGDRVLLSGTACE
ncbi:FecR family protein [Flavilitoribacter nigricans]|nr:FecR domain-containing protein [Flavilitoribacter nigricans]